MTAKRKRKRSRRRAKARATAAPPQETRRTERETEQQPRLRGALAGPPSPYPPLAVSLARGLRVVGASPLILAVAFGSLLASWGLFVVLGVEPPPRLIAALMALPPANLLWDVPVAFGSGPRPLVTVPAVLALAALRAVTLALLVALVAQTLGGRPPTMRSAVRRLPRGGATILSIYLLETALVILLLQVLAGVIGQLAVVGLVVALYFLVLAPAVAVVDGVPTRDALRRAVRAARLPGTRHLTLVVLYFLFLLWVSSIAPFGVLAPATPGVMAWSFGLTATFLHVAVLGAFVFRWLAVRDLVPAGQAPARERRPAARR